LKAKVEAWVAELPAKYEKNDKRKKMERKATERNVALRSGRCYELAPNKTLNGTVYRRPLAIMEKTEELRASLPEWLQKNGSKHD